MAQGWGCGRRRWWGGEVGDVGGRGDERGRDHLVPVCEGFQDGVLELAPLVARDLGMQKILALEGYGDPVRAEKGIVEKLYGGSAGRRRKEEPTVRRDFIGHSTQTLNPRQKVIAPWLSNRSEVRPARVVLSIRFL